MNDSDSLYAKKELCQEDSIPVFSGKNRYIDNYTDISNRHIKAMEKGIINPWAGEKLILSLENSTADTIRKYIKSGDKILDVGVGMGRLLEMIEGVEKYGVDISIPYLKEAAKKNIKVCCSMVEDLPYKKDFFDMVVCTDVLEHVLDLNLAIKNILNVLKPSGILIVRVPNNENMAQYLDKDFPYDYCHLRKFDEYSLELLFAKIFNCEIMGKIFCGYLPDMNRWKYRLPFSIMESSFSYIMDILYHSFGCKFIDFLNKLFFDSVEIIIVVRKPKDN